MFLEMHSSLCDENLNINIYAYICKYVYKTPLYFSCYGEYIYTAICKTYIYKYIYYMHFIILTKFIKKRDRSQINILRIKKGTFTSDTARLL